MWRADVEPRHRHSKDPRRSGALLQLHRDPRSMARCSLQEPKGPTSEPQCFPIVLPHVPPFGTGRLLSHWYRLRHALAQLPTLQNGPKQRIDLAPTKTLTPGGSGAYA